MGNIILNTILSLNDMVTDMKYSHNIILSLNTILAMEATRERVTVMRYNKILILSSYAMATAVSHFPVFWRTVPAKASVCPSYLLKPKIIVAPHNQRGTTKFL